MSRRPAGRSAHPSARSRVRAPTSSRRRGGLGRSAPALWSRRSAEGPGEPEVPGAHLDELTARPQPGKREWRIGPRGHRHGDLRGQVVQQERHRLMDVGPADDVVVIERDHGGTGEDVEIIDQADQDGVSRRAPACLEQRERLDAGLGLGGLDRGHQVRQEASEVVVARVESQPRHPAPRRIGGRQPLREECGLAEPSRCGDEDQPRPFAPVPPQHVDEAAALHQPTTRRGQMQLGAQYRNSVSVSGRLRSAADDCRRIEHRPSGGRHSKHAFLVLWFCRCSAPSECPRPSGR
jgi:hypothetical protein